MTLGLWLTLVLGQKADPQLVPLCPPGASEAFQATYFRAAEALERGDFSGASKLAARLPKPSFTIGWDDSAVPADRKATFRRTLDRAIRAWTGTFTDLKITVAAKGDIQVSFTPALPMDPESRLPAGAVFLASDDAKDPRIEAVIALKRLAPAVTVEAPQVEAEVAFAIGSYLGLARSPRLGSAMARTDGMSQLPTMVAPLERQIGRENLRISEVIRQAAAAKKKMLAAKPEASLNPAGLTEVVGLQGTIIERSIEVVNRGRAPVRYRVIPDCSCFTLAYSGEVEPGGTGLIRVLIDTTEFPGPMNKVLVFYSNDPEVPVRTIPVTGAVTPAYRVIKEGPPGNVVIGPTGGVETFFVVMPEDQPFTIKGTQIAGVSAVTEVEPFEGMLADPDLGEGQKKRKGYRVSVLFSPMREPGRLLATLTIATSSQKFPFLRQSFNVQQGIVANPTSLFLGEVKKEPTRAWILVTRPGRPFKVKSVTSDHPAFQASVEQIGTGDNHKVIVVFSGKADIGPISATIKVTTDDPEQPTLLIPVQGTVS